MPEQRPIEIGPDRPALLVVAAPKEAEAVLRGLGDQAEGHAGLSRWAVIPVRPGFELLVTGVGKACAAGAVATVFDPERHGAIINTGIAGALPVDGAPGIGDVIAADRSVYADEGIETPNGFADVASMGFSPAPPGLESLGLTAPADPALVDRCRAMAGVVGAVATVSTCAGTDEIAQQVVDRTGALAEAMEGAAVGFTALSVAHAQGVQAAPFLEIRVISNTTGDRDRQRWDLAGALDRLSALTADLALTLTN